MSHRSDMPYSVYFLPSDLDAVLPIRVGGLWEQSDKPIVHLHYHECLEVGYCHSGNGIFVVGDKVLRFGPGDVSFISQGEVHLARSAPGTTSRWTWIFLDPLRLVAHPGAAARLDATSLAGAQTSNILQAAEHPHFATTVLRLIEEWEKRAPDYKMALQALVWDLMIQAHRAFQGTGQTPRTSSDDYARLAPAIQRLSQDGGVSVTPSELARMCNLSEPHFRRIFHRTLGRSPREYGFDVRMSLAASLLQSSGRSILQVSQDTGFETLPSFNRMFRKTYQMSPREWRRMQQDGTRHSS